MKPILKTLAVCAFAVAPLFARAAEPPPPPPAADMGHEMMHGEGKREHGKRCEEEGMGMSCCEEGGKACCKEGGKGKSCCKMGMGHGMHPPGGVVMIPHLPPGHEKEQLQMEAEIHQKLGEILQKYAGQMP